MKFCSIFRSGNGRAWGVSSGLWPMCVRKMMLIITYRSHPKTNEWSIQVLFISFKSPTSLTPILIVNFPKECSQYKHSIEIEEKYSKPQDERPNFAVIVKIHFEWDLIERYNSNGYLHLHFQIYIIVAGSQFLQAYKRSWEGNALIAPSI